MYQKTRFSHKYLIISIDIDFIRFCFPFFYIRWLMGYIWTSPVSPPPTTTEYRLKFRFLRPSFTRTYVGIVSPSFVPSCAFFVAFRGNVVKRSVPIVYDMGIVRFILGKKVRRWQVGSIR